MKTEIKTGYIVKRGVREEVEVLSGDLDALIMNNGDSIYLEEVNKEVLNLWLDEHTYTVPNVYGEFAFPTIKLAIKYVEYKTKEELELKKEMFIEEYRVYVDSFRDTIRDELEIAYGPQIIMS